MATVREATENGTNHAVNSNDLAKRDNGNEFNFGAVEPSEESPEPVKANSNGSGFTSRRPAWGGDAVPNGAVEVKALVTSLTPSLSTRFGKKGIAFALGLALIALASVAYFTGRAGDAASN